MAGYENIKDKGFDKRTTDELREISKKGGQASGKARRKNANFRRTLNILLTTPIESDEWTPILEALGIESTLESAVNMAMIKKALAGNVKAYEAIARYSGQSERTELFEQEQQARTEHIRASTDKVKRDASKASTNQEFDDGVEIINDV